MSDDIDRAQAREYEDRERALSAAAKPLDPGYPGECEFCGRDLPRLIGGACGACRDRFGLP